jgi:hypothetical protein
VTDPNHAHIPGPPFHDDHVCTYVTCAVCGAVGRAVDDQWVDV